MASNLDNSKFIKSFISQTQIEGYRNVPYVPHGFDPSPKLQNSLSDLKKDWDSLLRNEKDATTKRKLELLRRNQHVNTAMNQSFVPAGRSGVTFSFGIDLGQVDADTLRTKYRISDHSIDTVKPYLRVTRLDELNLILSKRPVSIPSHVLSEFEEKYLTYFIEKTANILNHLMVESSGAKMKTFAELSKHNQSVLVSIIWQHGEYCLPKYKWINDVFTHARKNEWQKVKEILLSQTHYSHRRRTEAEILDLL